MTRCFISVFALAATLLLAQEPAITVRDAWVRLPLASKNETAMYVVVENHTAQKRAIVGASSDSADKLELHEMKMEKTLMKMTPVTQVALPAKGKASFDPNSYHIMMFGLKSKLAVGDMVTATLKLDDGTMVPVTATVRK